MNAQETAQIEVRMEIEELLDVAGDLLYVLQVTDQDTTVEEAWPFEWRAALALFDHKDPQVRLVGAALMLEALQAAPEALDQAVAVLHEQVHQQVNNLALPIIMRRRENAKQEQTA